MPNWEETNSRCPQFHWEGQHQVDFKVSGSTDFNVAVKATLLFLLLWSKEDNACRMGVALEGMQLEHV